MKAVGWNRRLLFWCRKSGTGAHTNAIVRSSVCFARERSMVKCAECGYLAVRSRNDQALVSPGDEQRTTGRSPEIEKPAAPGSAESTISWLQSTIPLLEVVPLCSLSIARLDEEFDAEYKDRGSQWSLEGTNAALAIVKKDRQCDRFIPWIRALSPKEHLDMDLFARQQAWQDERNRREESRDAKNLRLNLLLVLAAVAAAVAAWWSAMHPTVITIPAPVVQQPSPPKTVQ